MLLMSRSGHSGSQLTMPLDRFVILQYYNYTVIFVALQRILTFFQQKITVYLLLKSIYSYQIEGLTLVTRKYRSLTVDCETVFYIVFVITHY